MSPDISDFDFTCSVSAEHLFFPRALRSFKPCPCGCQSLRCLPEMFVFFMMIYGGYKDILHHGQHRSKTSASDASVSISLSVSREQWPKRPRTIDIYTHRHFGHVTEVRSKRFQHYSSTHIYSIFPRAIAFRPEPCWSNKQHTKAPRCVQQSSTILPFCFDDVTCITSPSPQPVPITDA